MMAGLLLTVTESVPLEAQPELFVKENWAIPWLNPVTNPAGDT